MVIVVLALTGCMKYDSNGTTNSGEAEFKRVCIDGVEYLSRRAGYSGYMAPHFKPDGSLYTCRRVND